MTSIKNRTELRICTYIQPDGCNHRNYCVDYIELKCISFLNLESRLVI